MPYTPHPIDTSSVVLPEEIAELTEWLARNNHEVWAQQRVADGWVLGPERSDRAKTHPCLVPYDELPESEKEYDRRTAMGVIKAMYAAGYKIERER